MAPQQDPVRPLPLLYTLFFLYIEPVSTLVGAYYAHFQPAAYMDMTLPSAQTLHPREPVVLTQLANLYLLFALNEALVLRASDSRKVWSAFLFGMLVADFGHVFSVHSIAASEGSWALYWEFWRWNAMYWGNLGFVYVGATMRTCFLLGVGLPQAGDGKVKASITLFLRPSDYAHCWHYTEGSLCIVAVLTRTVPVTAYKLWHRARCPLASTFAQTDFRGSQDDPTRTQMQITVI